MTIACLAFVILSNIGSKHIPVGWVILIAAFAVLSLWIYTKRLKFSLNESALLEHINRTFPKYEESAQLLIEDVREDNNFIRHFQKSKVAAIFLDDYSKNLLQKSLPSMNYFKFVVIVLLVGLLFIMADRIKIFSLSNIYSTKIHNDRKSNSIENEAVLIPKILDQSIEVESPKYSQIPRQMSKDFNINAMEGARVTWSVRFTNPKAKYFLVGIDGNKFQMTESNSGEFVADQLVSRTGIYRFEYQLDLKKHPIGDVYSISMQRDRPPKITVMFPDKTPLEFSQLDSPTFDLKVNIGEDFGLSEVKILASVAKGSGESVKFRDQQFSFDENIGKNAHLAQVALNTSLTSSSFTKKWSLESLEMEPGDEAYFNVIATDNKQPFQQTSRSESIIVRWLDEDNYAVVAEGMNINFLPEYFRSQRQIIVETEQLIEDKNDLSSNLFSEKSVDLGHSQSDLKRKYGQYLGDEFGEGPGEQFGLADGYHGGESLATGEATAGMNNNISTDVNKDDQQQELGHEHESEEHEQKGRGYFSGNKASLINRFTHTHNSIEVGPMGSKDPKSWMKLAVDRMWQAELHLMLSQPKLALPFEYQAYKYFKLARQAERIYAKRLGFEAPPVDESNRLSGELFDILTVEVNYEDPKVETGDNILFRASYSLLDDNATPLTKSQVRILERLKLRLLALADKRPALIKYATIAEKLILKNNVNMSDCNRCKQNLKFKLWQMLPEPVSLPNKPHRYIRYKEAFERSYLEEVQQQTNDLKEIVGG